MKHFLDPFVIRFCLCDSGRLNKITTPISIAVFVGKVEVTFGGGIILFITWRFLCLTKRIIFSVLFLSVF